MIIRYANGKSYEAVLLARDGNSIRAAAPGEDDALEFTCIKGVWVSDDCEPVHIQFAWDHKPQPPAVSEADCICAPELATRLIHLLLNPEEDAGFEVKPASGVENLASAPAIVQ